MEGWKPIDHGALIGETRLFSCLFLIKENADAKIQQDIQNCKVFPFIKIPSEYFDGIVTPESPVHTEISLVLYT